MSHRYLNIDDCQDEESIDDRMARLQSMIEYGNDLAPEIRRVMEELEERRRNLRRQN